MRKLLVILMMLAATGTAFAQRHREGGGMPRVRIEWGAIGGINIPNYTTNMQMADIGERMGWQAGIVTAVNFGAFAIEPQVLYVRNGLRVNYYGEGETASSIRLRSNSIDVPVLVSLRLLHPVRFYGGPVFTVMNDCKQKSGGDLLDFGRVRPTISYTLGIGVKLGRNMLVDLRYNGQFRAKHDVYLPDGNHLDKLRSYNVAFSIGYIF